MRFKLSAPLLALAAAAALVAPPPPRGSAQQQQQQQDEQEVTDSFVTTRGAGFGERPKRPAGTSASAAPPKKASRPGPTSANKTAKGPTGGAPKNNAKNNPAATKTTTTTATTDAAPKDANTPAHHADAPADEARAEEASAGPASPVGLGYTILKVGEDGSNTVVDPSTAFTAGDKIRVALETNADGYLYIFNAENDRATPQMLHPTAAVDNGANRIAAHARDFIPTDLRYSFVFDETVSTEHLYIIFSRRPLADVPTGAALVEYCRGKSADDCLWQPPAEQWARIKAAAAAGRVVESRNNDLAAARVQLPPSTLSRGLKVKKDEPKPAVVRMNASAASDVLLTKIELIHR